jgi:hypothetical protein
LVDGKVPSAFIVIRTGELMEQPVVLVAVMMHSTAANDAPGVNPDPVMTTFWPLISPVLGVMVMVGAAAAAAVATPPNATPPNNNATAAILDTNRFILKVPS